MGRKERERRIRFALDFWKGGFGALFDFMRDVWEDPNDVLADIFEEPGRIAEEKLNREIRDANKLAKAYFESVSSGAFEDSVRESGDWFTNVLARTKIRVAIAKLNIKMQIQKWTSETAGAVLFALVVVATMVIGAYVIPMFMALPIVDKIKGMIADLKKENTNLANAHVSRAFIAGHKILGLFSENYRGRVQELMNAIGGLAEQLSLPAGFMHMMMMNIKTASYSAMNLLGFGKEVGEIKFMENATQFLGKIKSRFFSYAGNPGQLMEHVDEWFREPLADAGGSSQGKIISFALDTAERVERDLRDVDIIIGSINDTIEALPEELERNFTDAFGKRLDDVQTVIDDDIRPVVTAVKGTIEILEGVFPVVEADILFVKDWIEKPGDFLRSFLSKTDEQIVEQSEGIAEAITASEAIPRLAMTNFAVGYAGNYVKNLDLGEVYTPVPVDDDTARVDLAFPRQSVSVIPAWFVAEY